VKQEAIKKEIKRFCQIARKINTKTIILFGSRARADYTEESDVDICVIAEGLSPNIFERQCEPLYLGYC
jgi:predicted nucleotidyltransferase